LGDVPVRYRRKLSKVEQKWQAGLICCRLSKGKQTADPQDGGVAGAYSADRRGSRRHRGGGIENDEDPKNVPCYGTVQNDLLHQRDNSVKDLIFGLDGEDHIDAKNVRNYLDAVYGGKKRGVLLLNDGDGGDRARRGRGAEVCSADPGDSSRSCPRAAPGSQPEGPFEAHMRSPHEISVPRTDKRLSILHRGGVLPSLFSPERAR
jgi:hypothetical protein